MGFNKDWLRLDETDSQATLNKHTHRLKHPHIRMQERQQMLAKKKKKKKACNADLKLR